MREVYTRNSLRSYQRTSDRYLTRVGLFQNDFELLSTFSAIPISHTLYKSNLYLSTRPGSLCRVQMVYRNSIISAVIDGQIMRHRVEFISRKHKNNAPRVANCWKLFHFGFSIISHSTITLQWYMERPISDYFDNGLWQYIDTHIILPWFDRFDRLIFSLCLRNFSKTSECFVLTIFIHQYL
jgi:hypothetical protein